MKQYTHERLSGDAHSMCVSVIRACVGGSLATHTSSSYPLFCGALVLFIDKFNLTAASHSYRHRQHFHHQWRWSGKGGGDGGGVYHLPWIQNLRLTIYTHRWNTTKIEIDWMRKALHISAEGRENKRDRQTQRTTYLCGLEIYWTATQQQHFPISFAGAKHAENNYSI